MSPVTAEPPALECLAGPRQAATVLRPLRLRILERLRRPASATTVAKALSLPRQRVNYHVRVLHDAGFLRRAGRRRRRGLVEQRYVASARAYVLSPDVLGPMAPPRAASSGPSPEEALGAVHLLAALARAQAEVAAGMRGAREAGKRLPSLAIETTVRFETAEQRTAFARALEQAVLGVVARHTAPFRRTDGSPGRGRPCRLVLAAFPVSPPDTEGEGA
jgi:DNA-binding transcriptional ArsR family regulator